MWPVLHDWQVHAWVSLDELWGLVLPFENVDLNVLELKLADHAVELECTAVSTEREANDIDLVLLDAWDVTRSSVSLVLAQVCSHLL